MTLQEKIHTLPDYPTWEGTHNGVPSGDSKLIADIDYYAGRYEAALARLALAREWILTSVPHLEGCPWRGLTRDAQGLLPGCSCGRDALLAAMEVPK